MLRQRWLLMMSIVASLTLAVPGGARAQEGGKRGEALSKELSLAERAARRMPQPVRVGDLVGRQVLEPSNHQGVLGRVAGVSRGANGVVVLVLDYGGVLGFGTRRLGVPLEATALLGPFVQVTDVEPAALKLQPDWTGAGATPLGKDDIVKVGLNRN